MSSDCLVSRVASHDSSSAEFIGVIPAAGIASRLKPCRYVKELLPVSYIVEGDPGSTMPVPVVELSLRALRAASVKRCIIAISDRKPELMRYLGDGSDFGLEFAYVEQSRPTGLAAAVNLAYNWTHGSYCCLVLPDTIVYPSTAMCQLVESMRTDPCNLALAVFPTDTPEQLGPVRFDSLGRVAEVLDKPRSTDLYNTWAMAVWSPEFSDLLYHQLEESTNLALGEVFDLAVSKGLNVRALWFPQGSFVDVGTGAGITAMLEFSKTAKPVNTPCASVVSSK
ncbi:MAG TPA: sugar phosphate nucleotidyltransferase [Terriglobia bacterium]|nr:sugar phosphate nucleotidyltransferase [Terriglobia bacterium]